MATKNKRTTKKQSSKEEVTEMPVDIKSAEPAKKVNKYGKIMTFGWLLLLLGGLGHMLPEQMAPVLRWTLAGVTFQTAIGVLSVIVALYYLLEEEK